MTPAHHRHYPPPRPHHPVPPVRVASPTHAGCRDTEWLAAGIMCCIAVVMSLPGDSLSGPAFAAFHRLGLTETFWACAFGLTGSMRLAALYINGRNPRTPYARMLGAVLGFVVWLQFGALIYQGTMEQLGVYNVGIAVFAGLAVAELRSVYRAGYDARYIKR